MGAAQAAQVLLTVKQQQRKGEPASAEAERRISDATRRQYEQEGHALYSTARLWDDGIVDPIDTRRVIGFCLDVASMAPIRESRAPVFRM